MSEKRFYVIQGKSWHAGFERWIIMDREVGVIFMDDLPRQMEAESVCVAFNSVDELRAENAKLRAELDDWRATQREALGEMCGDEQHCSCVPMLRREIKRLREAMREAFDWLQNATIGRGEYNHKIYEARTILKSALNEPQGGKASDVDSY